MTTTNSFEEAISKREKLKMNFIVACVLCVLPVIKYIGENYHFFETHKFYMQVYSFLFFMMYMGGILFVIWQIHIKQGAVNKYIDYWFTGFKAIIFICLLSVFVSLMMEFIFPNIRLNFLLEQEKIINNTNVFLEKTKVDKEQMKATLRDNYYYLKLSLFMFSTLVLGTILNTIVCLAVFFYFKQKRH